MASKPPIGLKERGRALWEKLDVKANTPAGVLGEEACRVADRIDHVWGLLEGGGEDAMIRQIHYKLDDIFNDDDQRDIYVTIKMTGLQAELRAQQALLRQLMVSVMALKEPDSAVGKGDPAVIGKGGTQKVRTAVDEFTAKRNQRRGGA